MIINNLLESEAIIMNEISSQVVDGHISFPNPNKENYTVDDILTLIEFNYGYSPFNGKIKDKSQNSYKSLRKKINRDLQDRRLKQSTPRKPLYHKGDVLYFLINSRSYFLRKTETEDNYKQNVEKAKNAFAKKFDDFYGINASELDNFLEKGKERIKIRILLKLFEEKFVTINDEFILDDLNLLHDAQGKPTDNLTDMELLALNRLSGDLSEYYEIKQ